MITINDLLEHAELESLDELLLRSRLSFKYWCENVVQRWDKSDEFLQIKEFHLEWFNMFYNNENNCVEAPRGSGKSVVLAVAFPLWLFFFKRDQQFLVVSQTQKQAMDLLDRFKTTIQNNELLQSLIPKGRGGWTKTELNTTTGCRMFSKPYSDAIRGVHINWFLADEGGTYKDLNIFWSALMPTITSKRGHAMVIGTPMTFTDLLAELKKNAEFKFKRYTAIVEDGKSYWPERYPLERLESKRRQMGDLKFNREYLCNVVSSEISLYPQDIIARCCDDEAAFEYFGKEDAVYYIGVDFAMVAGGDYTVITVVRQMESEDRLKVVNIKRFRGKHWKAQLALIQDICEEYKPKKILVDESSFGKTFLAELKDMQLPVKGFNFTLKTKNDLLTHLRSLMESTKVLIPRSDKDSATRSNTDTLISELGGFIPHETQGKMNTYTSTKKHDDTVMSLALACYLKRKRYSKHSLKDLIIVK